MPNAKLVNWEGEETSLSKEDDTLSRDRSSEVAV